MPPCFTWISFSFETCPFYVCQTRLGFPILLPQVLSYGNCRHVAPAWLHCCYICWLLHTLRRGFSGKFYPFKGSWCMGWGGRVLLASLTCKKPWVWSVALDKLCVVVCAWNLSSWRVETGESEFKIILGYIASLRRAWATSDPVLTTTNNHHHKSTLAEL